MPSNKHSSSKPHSSSRHKHSEVMSNPAFSHYPDHALHYYRWTSPPGVMKIVSIILIIMCVAIFACVASTLAWDYDMGMMGGMGGMLPGYGNYGSYGSSGGTGLIGSNYGGSYGGYGGGSGSSYGAGSGGYGSGGNMYMDPKSGKGFIIGVAGVTFIAVLVIFVLVVSRQSSARSHKFYLAAIIIGAILAFLMLIATIVYLVAVNPTAQSSGSMMYNQVLQLCAQYQNQNQAQGIFLNQYLYHYCVVEPQEAIAIVLGFLVVLGLIILVVFAARTRSQIRRWGEHRVLWEEIKVLDNGTHHNSIGEWVNNVSGEPEVMLNSPNTRIGGSRDFLDNLDPERPLYLPGESDVSSVLSPKPRDYDLGAESADELEEHDFSSPFPRIVDEAERLSYKREFDRDHQEYRALQAELDLLNQDLASLERELDQRAPGSPQFLDALDEFNRLKSQKKSPQYQMKKKRCKYLRSKLSHIKRQISDYDHRP